MVVYLGTIPKEETDNRQPWLTKEMTFLTAMTLCLCRSKQLSLQ